MVSRELEKECIVVFDEAHNIDNVCIEVMVSVESLLQHGSTQSLAGSQNGPHASKHVR